MTDSTRVTKPKKRTKTGRTRQKAANQDPQLTAPQLAALAALATAPTLRQAAERAGVSDRTLRTWMADNQLFKTALQEQRTEAREAITRNLVAVNGAALAVALQLMGNPLESSAIRMRAVEFVFEQTHKLLEQGDMAERLQEIEALLEAQENEKTGNKFF